MNKGPYDDPSKVGSEEGEVTVDGPDGVAISMTPEAAVETGDRLIEASAEALGQRAMADAKRDALRPPIVPSTDTTVAHREE